jgi:DNA segregation ATPase FtsK/SpoIIIE, S-DNA-T family
MTHLLAEVVRVITVAWLLAMAYVVVRLVIGLVRFLEKSPAARRNYWLRFRVRWTWRKLTLNLDLAKVIKESTNISSRPSIMPLPRWLHTTVGTARTRRKIRYPKMKIDADDYGVVLRVRTIPKVGRAEFEKAATFLADAWGCARVQVYQQQSGRLIVRGIRNDPLATMLPLAAVPHGVYSDPHAFRPYLGRDEWGTDRWLDLSGITGITIAGLPRYGKTKLIISQLMQWAGTRKVQLVILDGKGSGTEVGADYDEWVDRAWMASGDDLDRAEEIFTTLTDHMMERGRQIKPVLGVKNGWHVGPRDDWPLIITVVDECHTFFNDRTAGGQRALKEKYLRLQSLGADLVKKSGSVLMVTIYLTQKQSGDAIPTAIRDNCTVGISFAVKNREVAVVGLGDGIRDHPSLCPSSLRERPTYIGVCVAALPEGREDFIRLRIPDVPDEMSISYAARTAYLRTDPAQLLAALVGQTEPAPNRAA